MHKRTDTINSVVINILQMSLGAHQVLTNVDTPEKTLKLADTILKEISFIPIPFSKHAISELEKILTSNIPNETNQFLSKVLNTFSKQENFYIAFKLLMLIVDQNLQNTLSILTQLPSDFIVITRTILESLKPYISTELNKAFCAFIQQQLRTLFSSNSTQPTDTKPELSILQHTSITEYNVLIKKVIKEISNHHSQDITDKFIALFTILSDEEINQCFKIIRMCVSIDSATETEKHFLSALNITENDLTLTRVISGLLQHKTVQAELPNIILTPLLYLLQPATYRETDTNSINQLIDQAKYINATLVEQLKHHPNNGNELSTWIRYDIFEHPTHIKYLFFNEKQERKQLTQEYKIGADTLKKAEETLQSQHKKNEKIDWKRLQQLCDKDGNLPQLSKRQSKQIITYFQSLDTKQQATRALSKFIQFISLTPTQLDNLLVSYAIDRQQKNCLHSQIVLFHSIFTQIIGRSLREVLINLEQNNHDNITKTVITLLQNIFNINNSKNTGEILSRLNNQIVGRIVSKLYPDSSKNIVANNKATHASVQKIQQLSTQDLFTTVTENYSTLELLTNTTTFIKKIANHHSNAIQLPESQNNQSTTTQSTPSHVAESVYTTPKTTIMKINYKKSNTKTYFILAIPLLSALIILGVSHHQNKSTLFYCSLAITLLSCTAILVKLTIDAMTPTEISIDSINTGLDLTVHPQQKTGTSNSNAIPAT